MSFRAHRAVVAMVARSFVVGFANFRTLFGGGGVCVLCVLCSVAVI